MSAEVRVKWLDSDRALLTITHEETITPGMTRTSSTTVELDGSAVDSLLVALSCGPRSRFLEALGQPAGPLEGP